VALEALVSSEHTHTHTHTHTHIHTNQFIYIPTFPIPYLGPSRKHVKILGI